MRERRGKPYAEKAAANACYQQQGQRLPQKRRAKQVYGKGGARGKNKKDQIDALRRDLRHMLDDREPRDEQARTPHPEPREECNKKGYCEMKPHITSPK